MEGIPAAMHIDAAPKVLSTSSMKSIPVWAEAGVRWFVAVGEATRCEIEGCGSQSHGASVEGSCAKCGGGGRGVGYAKS